MKRGKLNHFFSFVVLIGLIKIVSAQSPNIIEQGWSRLSNDAGSLFSNLFTTSLPTLNLTAELFARLIYPAILFFIIYSTTEYIDFLSKKKVIRTASTVAITALIIIALPDGFIELIHPAYYSALSTLLVVGPFLFVAYLSIKVKSQIVPRVLWLIMLIFSILLFITQGIPAYQNGDNTIAITYTFYMLASLGATIFLPTLRNFFFKGEAEELTNEMQNAEEISQAYTDANVSAGKTLAKSVKK